MKRIFYFTGHRISVLHWSGKRFSGACSFEPNDEGYLKFEQYLQNSVKIATRLLVDVIEEDFRIETIPHVYGKDRAAVIARKIDRHYRASRQFTYAEIIARQRQGRKDDEVLIGALTNPDLIQPWLDIIAQCDVPLSGIWSLPLVSRHLLPVLGARKGPTLLVSQQVNSNLRQTFFRDGKMIASRQSVINLDAENIHNVGDLARPEVQRTVTFLRSQSLIQDDELLHVHVLSADEQVSSLEAAFVSSDNEKVVIHRIAELEQKIGFSGGNSRFADGLFAWLCLTRAGVSGHYGSRQDKSRYFYSLASTGLYAASIVVLVSGLLLSESFVSSAVEYNKAGELLAEQEREYRQIYKNKFESYEEIFANAAVMNAAVDLASRIEQHGRVSPLDMMIELSLVMRDAGLDDVTIDAISWRAEQLASTRSKKQPDATRPDVVASDRLRHVAIVNGRLSISTDNYSASVDRINDILDALRNHERVELAEAISMPVEVRSEKKFTAESGSRPTREQKKQGEFSLRVVMKAIDDA